MRPTAGKSKPRFRLPRSGGSLLFLLAVSLYRGGQLNSDVVAVVGIIFLFSVEGVVGVGAGVEASSEAW